MSIAAIVNGQKNRELISCAPEDTVREAAGRLADKRIGCLPVIENGQVVGMFSERDLVYCIVRDGGAVLDRPVKEVMTAPAITIDKSADALQALSLMTKRRIRHLPVMENQAFVGFISIGDLVKYRMDRIEQEAQAMREYITQS